MKNLFKILIILICFYGCASSHIYEDTLYVTRKYVGDFEKVIVEKKISKIYTTDSVFCILGKPNLSIPDSVRCYVKYIPERLAGNNAKTWILYFTWDGTEDLFMLYQNYITGELLYK